MEITPLKFEGCWLAKAPVLEDERGYFREWFKSKDIEVATGHRFNFEQGNISQSSRGTVRGIHYSLALAGQAKWITCVNGSIKDFIVDITPGSPTFGQYIEIELEASSGLAVLIGEKMGHAFVSLEEKTTVVYLVSTPYSPNDEYAINPCDSDIGINWSINHEQLKISSKDQAAPTLKNQLISGKLPFRLENT